MKVVALEGVGGTTMGRHEKTSVKKIRNGAGSASSSLNGESAYTHHGAKDRVAGCVGGINGRAPKTASRGRFGSCGAASIDCCDQARVWSHAEATNSPRSVFRWFSSRLEELEAPLVVGGGGGGAHQ